MRLLGLSLIIFFGIIAVGTILFAGFIRLIINSAKELSSIFKGGKEKSKTYHSNDDYRKEQNDENITIIDAEIVKESLLKPYISDIKNANKNNDEEITNLLNNLVDVLQSMDNYIANHRDKEDDINMMAEYYILEMLNHLKTYQEMKTSYFKSRRPQTTRLLPMETL